MARVAAHNVQTFTFKKGKIRIDYDTGFVTNQKGRRLPVDETIHRVVGFEVPPEVMEEIQKAQDALESKYYEKEIHQAMEEAKAAKLAEIRARKKRKEEADAAPKPKLYREEIEDIEEDDEDDDEAFASLPDEPDYDDFSEDDLEELMEPPKRKPTVKSKPAAKKRKPTSKKKKKSTKRKKKTD